MRRCVAPVNLITKGAPEFSTFFPRYNVTLTSARICTPVLSPQCAEVLFQPNSLVRSQRNPQLFDVALTSARFFFWANAVLARGMACFKKLVNA